MAGRRDPNPDLTPEMEELLFRYLEGNCDQLESTEVEKLLAENPGWQSWMNQIQQLDRAMEEHVKIEAPASLLENVMGAYLRQRESRIQFPVLPRIAIGILVGILLLFAASPLLLMQMSPDTPATESYYLQGLWDYSIWINLLAIVAGGTLLMLLDSWFRRRFFRRFNQITH